MKERQKTKDERQIKKRSRFGKTKTNIRKR